MNIVIVALTAFAVNLPLGLWRRKYKKLTLPWWLIVHASIPVIIAIRIWLGTPYAFIPLFIAAAVLGQLIGGKLSSKNRTG